MVRSAALPEPGRPRHIVITGASSGIGAALAQVYARPKTVLSLFGRNGERLEAVARSCRALGAEASTHLADVTDAAEMQRLLTACDEGMEVDIVVANAGVGGRSALTSNAGEDGTAAARIFATNVIGVVHTVTPLLPRFVARRRGHIVIIGSLAGFLGLPDAPAYSASKAAVRAYGHGLRRLIGGSGVKVTVVSPGFVETPMSASLPFRRPFLWSAERAALRIARDVARGKNDIAFPFPLALLARLGALLPMALTDRILGRNRR